MERLFSAFREAGKELFLVGGAVRDLAMGHAFCDLDDLDFTTNCRPAETLAILKANGIRTYKLGIEFGTVGAVLSGEREDGFPKDVQITTYRSAEYYRRGSRHPVVQFGTTIEQDLKRRDFSINSIAMDDSGAFVDPYDGLGDIRRQVLRVVGDPVETLAEDPLRILRIGRFYARLGFEPSDDLKAAAYHQATALLDISRQRWTQELNKVLVGDYVGPALDFLLESRTLGLILPEVAAIVGLEARSPVVHDDYWAETKAQILKAGNDVPLSWAALLLHVGRPWTRNFTNAGRTDARVLTGLKTGAIDDAGAATFDRHHLQSGLLAKGIGRRLHFDNKTTDSVSFMLERYPRASAYVSSWSDADVRAFVRDTDPLHNAVIDLAAVATDNVELEADLSEFRARISALEAEGKLRPSLPSGIGKVLMRQLGLPAGPAVGEVIGWLNEEIIAGHLDSDLDPAVYVNYLESERPTVLVAARDLAGPSVGGKSAR